MMPKPRAVASWEDLPLFVDIPFDAGGMVLMSKTRRSDGRMHDSGLIRPNRPCPKDFREKFIELGWGGIGVHYHASWRCIRRWVLECGRDELKKERAAYVGRNGREALHVSRVGECLADRQARRRRNVMGQTLTPKRGGSATGE
jgi:hypothetical protein